jgi:uncharacterized membrane protein
MQRLSARVQMHSTVYEQAGNVCFYCRVVNLVETFHFVVMTFPMSRELANVKC